LIHLPATNKRRDAAVLALIVTAGVWVLLAAVYLDPSGMLAGDSAILFLQAKASATQGVSDLSLSYPATGLDRSYRYFPFRKAFQGVFTWGSDTERYGKYSEAYALIAGWFFRQFQWRGLQIPSLLFGLASLYLATLIMLSLKLEAPCALPIILGLGTPILYYSLHFSSHVAAVFWICLAVWLTTRGLRHESSHLSTVGAGLAAAVAWLFRPESALILMVVPLAIFMTLGRTRQALRLTLQFLGGALLVTAPMAAWNLARMGSPLGPHMSIEMSIGDSLSRHLNSIGMQLLPAGHRKWILVIIIAAVAWLAARFAQAGHGRAGKLRAVLPYVVILIGYAAITVVHLETGYVPHISFTDVFPAAAVALCVPLLGGILKLQKDRPTALVCYIGLLYVLSAAVVAPTWGGRGWGPRFLLAGYPLIAIFVCHVFFSLRFIQPPVVRSLLIAAGSMLLGLSFLIQSLGIIGEHNDRKEFADIACRALELNPNLIVTNLEIYPQLIAPVWDDLRVLGVTSASELSSLIVDLRRHEVQTFWWVDTAYAPWRKWRSAPILDEAGTFLQRENLVALREIKVADKLIYTLYRIGR
jgi:hypothetical protein